MVSRLLLLSAFSDFFPDVLCPNGLKNPPANYYVGSCFFNSITSAPHGGVISMTLDPLHFVVENVVFYYCRHSSSAGYGGCIYFYSTSGAYAFSKVCANRCYAGATSGDNRGMFAHCTTYRNHTWDQVTMFQCPEVIKFSNQYGVVDIQYGIRRIYSININGNKVQKAAGFRIR